VHNEKIQKQIDVLEKKLSKETEEKIVSRSFIVILILAVIITVLDIMRFF